MTDVTSDKQLSDEESLEIAARVREELARRRVSRRYLANEAKISLSTLEKVLAGRRAFTLATTVRLEEALGVLLRRRSDVPSASGVADVAPDELGAYVRRAVGFVEGDYLTLRPSFGQHDAIYAYRTEICWDEACSCLTFRESERLDSAYTQDGSVSIPHESGHIYLVTNRGGQYRLITVSRPTRTGEMYGILMTLQAGRGAQLTPVAAPIAFVPLANVGNPRFGRITSAQSSFPLYRGFLKRTIDESFAILVSGG